MFSVSSWKAIGDKLTFRVALSEPTVTVLIAARPDQAEVKAVASSRAFDYPPDRLEVLVARGKQPSAQRNAGLRAAKGELVYFLDDDSVPDPGNLRRVVSQFEEPSTAMVGGPNLCPPDAPAIERVFSAVLSAWLAFGPSRARYTSVGTVRPTSEKELILCNLIARRKTLLDAGGFDEALYPNEENALMDQLQKRGFQLLYDPEFWVWRRPRPHLRAFSRMLMTYGRGRAEQFRVNPTFGSVLNFVPPAFVLYLLILPVLIPFFGRVTLVPLLLYAVAIAVQGISLVAGKGIATGVPAAALVVVTHVLYGVGFWRGLCTALKREGAGGGTPVKLESIRLN